MDSPAAPSSQDAFTEQVAPLRAELRAHCYRMLGTVDEADDALQEALLRAWRGWSGFAGRGSLRSWLYTVATRSCLDAIEQRGRRWLPIDLGPASAGVVAEDTARDDVRWLGPFPGGDLATGQIDPQARYEQREAVELAFVAALQHLTGNQRAALLLFEVAGLSAAEVATVMGASVASANSALQRARRAVAARVPERARMETVRQHGDARLAEMVGRFCLAMERGDVDRLVSLLTEDATWSMPPLPHWYRGKATVADFAARVPLGSCGSWRALAITANAGPAAALYLRPPGASRFAAWSINVLSVEGRGLRDITSFLGSHHFPAFGIPLALD
ncbi:MAG: RNA polymerase subunit sigma-70 [Candidatus Dormibacteraceae bacterium]